MAFGALVPWAWGGRHGIAAGARAASHCVGPLGEMRSLCRGNQDPSAYAADAQPVGFVAASTRTPT
jgi:hypothetical protein